MNNEKIELVHNGAELAPAQPIDLTDAHLMLGIDVGSTTVKLSIIDENGTLLSANYERHPSICGHYRIGRYVACPMA